MNRTTVKLVLTVAALADATGWGAARISYYGSQFHGRLTASGIRFDRNTTDPTRFTAAVLRHHRTKRPLVPFGTIVRIKNGSKTILACVTDTGSYVPPGWSTSDLGGRMWFDLQPAAFKQLAGGSLKAGRLRQAAWQIADRGTVGTCRARLAKMLEEERR